MCLSYVTPTRFVNRSGFKVMTIHCGTPYMDEQLKLGEWYEATGNPIVADSEQMYNAGFHYYQNLNHALNGASGCVIYSCSGKNVVSGYEQGEVVYVAKSIRLDSIVASEDEVRAYTNLKSALGWGPHHRWADDFALCSKNPHIIQLPGWQNIYNFNRRCVCDR